MPSKKSQRSVSTAKPPVIKLPPANETTPTWETRSESDWRMPVDSVLGSMTWGEITQKLETPVQKACAEAIESAVTREPRVTREPGVENISRPLYLEVCRDDHGLVHAIFPMDFGHFEEATDPTGCLIQFDKKGGTALSLFQPGEWMVLRAPKFERLTGEISTEKFNASNIKSVASRCTGKHSTIAKAQALKIAFGSLAAYSKSLGYGHYTRSEESVFSLDYDAMISNFAPGCKFGDAGWSKARELPAMKNPHLVVDLILNGPPFRQEWIKSSIEDRNSTIAANRLFIGVVLALLPNEDGSMHPYGGEVGPPSGTCLTPNCEGHIGDEPCVSAQSLHESNGELESGPGPVTAIDGFTQLSQIKATFNKAMSTKIATPFMIVGHNSAQDAACALIPHLVALGYTPFAVKINPVNDGPKMSAADQRIVLAGFVNPALKNPVAKWWADHGVQLAVEEDPLMTEKVGIIYSWITASTSSP